MKKVFVYLLFPLRLLLDDIINMDIIFNFRSSDAETMHYNGYQIDNIKKCRKWASIIEIVILVICSNKHLFGWLAVNLFDRMQECIKNEEYFFFILLILSFLVGTFLLVCLLRLIGYYISFLIFAKAQNTEDQSDKDSMLDI